MAKNEAKIKFTAETGEFNKKIQKSNSEMTELRAEMKLNETQMKATGKTVEGLENQHSILEKQLKASQDKTEALNQKVQKAVEIFGENSDEAAKLRTQLLNAQTAEEKLRQAVAQCADELESQKSTMKQVESASEQLANTIEKQQTELKQLKNEYTDAVLAHGKYSKEARSLAKQIDSLSSELDQNQKRMKEVENAADKLDNSLDNLDETAEKVSEGFTVMKGAMADLVADGISKVTEGLIDIGTEAFTMANDIDKATNTFITKTGESQHRAEEFEDAMTSIYNGNYGESFEDIADAMATVKTSMGDIGTDKLEQLTTKALVCRDTFDMDVNESIRAVNSMMDQFGVTADEAYNLIAQGAQNGLNQNGDLLDVVNEYSVQFKNAGYSADDMFNMLANGVDAGTWSVDKLGDAVKEFNIRARDGTVGDAIKENAKAFGMTQKEAKALASQVGSGSVGAYQKLADKLRSVDNDTKRYQLGVSLFGTMWEDLGEDAVMALLDTKGQISTTKDALNEINAVKYDDLGSAFEGIKRNLQTSVAEPIKEDVMPAVNEFVEDVDWQGIGQTIGEVMGVAVDAVFSLVEGTAQAVQWMGEHKAVLAGVATAVGIVATAIGAYNVVNGIKAAMDAAQVTTVWALVSAHIAQAAAAMAAIAPYVLIVAAIAAVIAIIVVCVKHWDEITAACGRAWEGVKATLSQWGAWINTNVIQPVVNFFKGLWQSMQNIWSSICDGAKAAWDWIKENVSAAANAVSSAVSKVFTKVKTFFSTVWNACKSVVSSVWSTIKNLVANAVQAVFSKVSTIWNKVKSVTSTVFNACKSVASNIWNGLKSVVTKVVDGVKTKVSNVWNGIKSTTSNVFNGLKSTVSNVWNKIKDAIMKPIETARDKVKAAIDKMKSFFNFSWSLPKIKLPHFKITGKFSLNPPSVPKFSIQWYKLGAIFKKPTLFNTPYGIKGVGEAGAEAVLPINKLEGYIANAIEKTQNIVNLDALAEAIEDLANRPVSLNINGRQFALATAGDGDSVNGLRSTFKSRGLVLD